jgi:hypothetical protein
VAFRLATGSTTGDLIYSLRGVLGEETKIKPIFQEGDMPSSGLTNSRSSG